MYMLLWLISLTNCSLNFFEISVDGLSIPVEERNDYEWLQERDKPDDVKVVGEMYSGPKIVES